MTDLEEEESQMTEQEWQEQPHPAEPAPGFPDERPLPWPEERSHTVVAWFAEEGDARACFRGLKARAVEVTLAAEPHAAEAAPPDAEAALPERGMGRGVVLGASVGATAGFLAATYLVPPLGAASATGTMLTTLAGAGLGTFFGNLADQGLAADRRGADPAGGERRARFRVEARVGQRQVNEVLALVSAWGPQEVRLQ